MPQETPQNPQSTPAPSAPTPAPAATPPSTPPAAAQPTQSTSTAPAAQPNPTATPSTSTGPSTPPPAADSSCKCPTINTADWDKKKTTINKTFFKAYSPRLFYYPFSFVIDVFRAQKNATTKGYKVVESGSVMSDFAMFWGNVFVEVTGSNANDPNVLSLEGKEVYTTVSKSDYKNIKSDVDAITKDLGKAPNQLFIWWTSCPKCMGNKEAKAVLIALP